MQVPGTSDDNRALRAEVRVRGLRRGLRQVQVRVGVLALVRTQGVSQGILGIISFLFPCLSLGKIIRTEIVRR